MDLLAIAVSALDLSGGFDEIVTLDPNGLIAVATKALEGERGYFARVISILDKRLRSSNEDIFELDPQEIERLDRADIVKVNLEGDALKTIRVTQLFKILDPTPRAQYIDKLDRLQGYNIYLGTIDEFLDIKIVKKPKKCVRASKKGKSRKQSSKKTKKLVAGTPGVSVANRAGAIFPLPPKSPDVVVEEVTDSSIG